MDSANNGHWIAKALASGAIKALAYQLVTVAMPFLVAGLTLAAGRIGGDVPWMWALMATSLSFGGVAAGTFYVLEVVRQRAVDGRLACVSPRVAIDMQSGGVCLGVDLRSLADVPVDFEVKLIRTELGGSYAPSKPFERTSFVIPPQGVAFFNDHAIKPQLAGSGPEVVEGSVDATILYGRPGSRKYTLKVRRKMYLNFSVDGQVVAIAQTEMA